MTELAECSTEKHSQNYMVLNLIVFKYNWLQ